MKPLRTHPPEPALLILLSLASGEKHGHAMVPDIEAFSGIRVGPADMAHYERIILAITETVRLMGETDAVIDQHGGWPDAFRLSRTG